MRHFFLFFILLTTFSVFSTPTRKETVIELVKQANRILPWNWFIVHTDTSLTAYFCRTSLNKAVGEKGVFIENQDLYGDQFWGAPIPDSVYIPSLAREFLWNKAAKSHVNRNGGRPICNSLLRIDSWISSNVEGKFNSRFYPYQIVIEGSIPDQEDVYFYEKTTPRVPYYGKKGQELTTEYQRLLLTLKFLVGLPDPS